MQTSIQPFIAEEWVKILGKGMVTLPKRFRDDLGIREGELAKVKKIGKRLVIEPRDVADYETYSDEDLAQMLAEDELPKKLAQKAKAFWKDLP